jgi:hypothetical protein
MELILRKRLTGDLIRVSEARMLCRSSRKLAFVAPYPGQWIFYALGAPGSASVRYNRQPAPPRCPVEVGDLLDLDGTELIVNSVEVNSGEFPAQTSTPSPCAIEVPQEGSVQVTSDRLIGYDPCRGLCLAATLDQQQLTALLASVAGRWHLHALNGNPLIRNGKPSGPSLVLVHGDRVQIRNKDVFFHIGRPAPAGTAGVTEPEGFGSGGATICGPRASLREGVEIASLSPSREIDFVYRKSKGLCQRLLPVLCDRSQTFQVWGASSIGIRGWLRFLRRSGSPAETLDRLELLLSGSPRDRVWLVELSRFLFQQSYYGLCLRVVKELCRLYPQDGELMQMLAKIYYQQGRSPCLPAITRLNALEGAEKCTQLARRLAPDDYMLTVLQRAVSVEQTILRGRL